MPAPEPRLEIPPLDSAAAAALERDLGVSAVVAQVLVRRGLADAARARDWLAAGEEHDAALLNLQEAVSAILLHVRAGSRITVHGDYDVDGVCSTAILVRALRVLGADVDWYLPSRTEDGYGLAAATVRKLAARGTALLVTADCAITAVEEVALAAELGMDVVVTDHHSPRADGISPAAPTVHPALSGYPCPDLCAGGVAHKVAGALLAAAGADPSKADEDLDLVALATIADCVPLHGENRRLVRAGLAALGTTRKAGLRALMQVARVDPGRVDATAVGFRLAPRLNAAGRLLRADAALELLLTEDEDRAWAVAEELDRLNADRRAVEQRILWEAEAQVAELGERPAYVLAGRDWHPGVIGIVASRIAEAHHRPAVLIALDGGEGTGSGRSIPGFDLLAGLTAASGHLLRYGGHRAAAGCTISAGEVERFRAAFEAHAAATLTAEDLIPRERVDAVAAGDELGQALAEELAALAPFGMGNPSVSLLVPAARLVDPRPVGEGKHVRFTIEAGGRRAKAIAFGLAALPEGAAEGRLHATFTLELEEFRGVVEPKLILRKLVSAGGELPELLGEPEPGGEEWAAQVVARAKRGPRPTPLHQPDPPPGGLEELLRQPVPAGRSVRDRRGGGVAGTIAAAVHSGEPVLVVCADALARRRHFAGRLGGFGLVSWERLARDPALAAGARHLIALDPPLLPAHGACLHAGSAGGTTHLAWGAAELRFAEDVLDRDYALRGGLTEAYRALRAGSSLAEALGSRGAAGAGRLLAVLAELGLVELEEDRILVPPAQRTELERSETFRRAARTHDEGRTWLTSTAIQRAA